MRVIRMVVVLLAALAGVAPAGCGGVDRSPHEQAYLLERRKESEAFYLADTRERFVNFAQRIKAECDDHAAGRRPDRPVMDCLIVSGGGDWGAFGAGFLKGWGTIPKSDPMARPDFDVVTGVSTGALIAPFAFIGDHDSIEAVVRLYRNPQKDWVKQRWPLDFLPNNLSFAEVPGLERELRDNITLETAKKIAEAGKDGRMLAVNTTNLDDASPRVFHLTAEAQRAVETGDMSRLHNIMLASAGIPAAFPYREIDGAMYVDGGVTTNIIYGGRLAEEDSIPAVWQRMYPDSPMPKLRYWVLFNNQLRTPPTVVRARWPDITSRALSVAIRSSTLTAVRHLYAMAEISRLKRHADIEVRIVAIPDDWIPPDPGVFVKTTMENLADMGEKMGADPASWRSDIDSE
jgi:predicted acylesterase/phospholipase RssA